MCEILNDLVIAALGLSFIMILDTYFEAMEPLAEILFKMPSKKCRAFQVTALESVRIHKHMHAHTHAHRQTVMSYNKCADNDAYCSSITTQISSTCLQL